VLSVHFNVYSVFSISLGHWNNQPAHSSNRHSSSYIHNNQPKVEAGSHIVYNLGAYAQNNNNSSGSSSNGGNSSNARQPTITIRDTPSPAVSVITISDSDEEAPR